VKGYAAHVTSSRRWLVFAVFAFVNLTIQMLWIAYAPITHQSAAFYGTSELGVTPEGTSSGLIQLVGQGSVVFVFGMEATKQADGSFSTSLLLAMVLIIAAGLASTRLEEQIGEPSRAAAS
jgi:hypothetical protein